MALMQVFSLAIAAFAVKLARYRHPHDVAGYAGIVKAGSLSDLEEAWSGTATELSDTGEFLALNRIHFAETVFVKRSAGCEAYATDNRGRVWALPTTADGPPRLVIHVGGTLLGGAFDAKGGMYLADATRGLLYVAPGARDARIVASIAPSDLSAANDDDGLDKTEIRYCNDVAVDDATGLVYFTDSTRIAPSVGTDRRGDTLRSYLDCHITGDASGRLLVYDPSSGATHVLVTGIPFANGVGVSKDGDEVYFASSSGYSVRKVAAVRDSIFPSVTRFQDTARLYNGSLPGIPDGLTVDREDGSIYVPVFGPPTLFIRLVDAAPRWLRQVLVSLPTQWRPKTNQLYTMIAQFDRNGTLLHVRHDTKRVYGLLTSVDRCGKYLFCGALKGHFGARFTET